MRTQVDMSGRLPFAPEPEAALRARYPAALAELYDAEGVRLGSVTPPTRRRPNVFDFEDGLRLIVSRDDHGGEAGVVVHLSAGLGTGTALERTLRGAHCPGCVVALLCERVEGAWRTLRGRGRLRFLGLSGGDVPHWIAPAPRD